MRSLEYMQTCPICKGECGWESFYGLEKEWVTCWQCDGEGEIDALAYREYHEEMMAEQRFEASRDCH